MNRNYSISACLVVKNEEELILDCINSVRDIADEIIVVDNGCTDNTLEVLKQSNCIVINGKGLKENDARSIYLERASSEWILLIDGDERFEKKDAASLSQILNTVDSDTWGVELKRNDYIGDGKWSENYILRIIRNNGRIKYNDTPIHTSVASSILDNDKKIVNSDVQLHHIDILVPGRTALKRHKYKNLLIEVLNKANNGYSKLDVDFIQLSKSFLALEYIAECNYIQAEALLLDTIKSNTRYHSFAVSLLCQMYVEIGEYQKIVKYIDEYEQILLDTNVMGNFYYFNDKEKCIEMYSKQITRFPHKYANYVNLCFLLKDRDKEYARNLLQYVYEHNTYISEPIIYGYGYEPNIFKIQSSILTDINNLSTLIEDLDMKHIIRN